MKPQVVDAQAQDVYKNWQIQKDAWLAGYVNKEVGINENDVLSFFDENLEHNKKKLKEREDSVGESSNAHLWEAKINEEIVGFIAAKKGDKCEIEALFVSPEFQKKGVGGILLNTALEWMNSLREVYVSAVSRNQNAINFYKHHGFIETGKTEDSGMDFPSGKRVINLEMVKRLSNR